MAQVTAEPSTSARTGTGSGVAGVIGLGTAVAVLVAAGLTALSGARPIASLGLPDPVSYTHLTLPTN